MTFFRSPLTAHALVFRVVFLVAALFVAAPLLALPGNCKSVDGALNVNVNHCVQSQVGCINATVSELRGTEFSNSEYCAKILENGFPITGCINNLPPGASSVLPLNLATGPGVKTIELVAGCIDLPAQPGTPQPIFFKSLSRVDVQVLASAPVGGFSNIECALTGGATTCSSQFSPTLQSNMRWTCLWSKTQASLSSPDKLLQCFNTLQSSSWSYVYEGVTAAPQTIELRGYGGLSEPSLGSFNLNPQSYPLLQSKVVSASTTPLVTGSFTQPCIASGAAPCTVYISDPTVGNRTVAWTSNFSGAVDIKRRVNSNSTNPSWQDLSLNVTASGAVQVAFTADRTDQLQLTKANTNELLATLTVRTLFDECLALPPVANGVIPVCPKGREAFLSVLPAQTCVSGAASSQCTVNAIVAEALPQGATGNCVQIDGLTDDRHCGSAGFLRPLTARPYRQTVVLRDRLSNNPFTLGCQLSHPINYCARYAASSTGSLSATPCAFTGSNCNTTLSATKSSAIRSCLWRKSSATTATKISCSEQLEWSVPWSGAISGPTVIELRASNDPAEPAQYNPTQNLLASVTLQTCLGVGQFPAAPATPNLSPSTNLLSFPVSWTAVSGACEYVLERQIGMGDWITRQSGIGTVLLETVTEPGRYSYRVKACNSAANQAQCSAYSPIASINVITNPQVGFTQPCGLNVAACEVAAASTAGVPVSIAWNAMGLSNPRVEETDLSTAPNSSQIISPTGVSPQTRTLLGGRNYRFQLFDGASLLKTVTITMRLPTGVTPLVPASLTATVLASGGVQLAWQASNNATHYQMQRVVVATGKIVDLGSTADLSFTDASAPAGTHRYEVRACNGTLCSAFAISANVTVVTSPGPVGAGEIADDPSGALYNPALHDYQSPQANDPTLAGASAGQAAVSGGSASYNMPIQLPPGRHGMQPSVSLNYSSRSGNGVAGMGFGLAAGGAMSRCPQTLAADNNVRPVRFDGEDRLCLNGERLIAVSGDYGTTGTQYKTELDSFVLVTQFGNSRSASLSNDSEVYFQVQTKSGERQYYGADASGVNQRNARVKPLGAVNASTLSWLLDTQLDRSDNNVQYTYVLAGSGENLLSRVSYTGTGAAAGNRIVDFVYEARADRSASYLAGALSEQTRRLSSVVTSAEGAQALSYKLLYSESATSSRSLLQSIQQCGFVGATEKCFAPTTFDWDQANVGFDAAPLDQRGWNALPRPSGVSNNWTFSALEVVQFGDINGDGTRELRASGSWHEDAFPFTAVQTTYLISQSADRSIAAANLLVPTDPLVQFRASEVADFNNDGRADFAIETLPSQTLPSHTVTLFYYNPDIVVANVLREVYSSARLVAVATNIEAQYERKKFIENIGTSLFPVYKDIFSVTRDAPQMVDVNGDGLTDLAGAYPSSACPATAGNPDGMAFEWYQNLGPGGGQQIRFDSARKRVFCLQPFVLTSSGHVTHEIVTKTIDFDGNGLPDYFIGKPVASSLALFPDSFPLAFNDVRFAERSAFDVIAATRGNINMALAGRDLADSQAQWIDINGDGLVDLVYPELTWKVQINVGGRMSQAAPFDTANNATLEKYSFVRGQVQYRDSALAQFADLDSDGKTELVVPYAFEAMGCYSSMRESPIVCPIANGRGNPGACNALVFCPASPQMTFIPNSPREQDPGLAHYPVKFWSNGEPANETNSTFQMTNHESNPSIYKMRGLKFVEVRSGSALVGVNLVAQALPATPLLFSPGKSINNQDLHADGLDDMLSSFGCREQGLAGSPMAVNCHAIDADQIHSDYLNNVDFFAGYDNQINFSAGSEGIQALAAFPTRLLLSRNSGAGERAADLPPKSPDMLRQVNDAFGDLARFEYYPLSSKAGRAAGELALYKIPGRDSGQGYVDANHFYFTSSMNVVAQMHTRNGVGGMNTTRYGYEEAMYNNKGRGFTGFRKIITEDLSSQIRAATVYEQKFPLISQAVCSVTQLTTNALADLKCDSTNAISLTKSSGYLCNDSTCELLNPPQNTPIRVVSNTSESVTRDLVSRFNIVSTTVANSTFDSYGNVTAQSSTLTDKLGGADVRTLSSTSSATYENDPNTWWLGKLTHSTSTVSQSYTGQHTGGPSVPSRSSTMLIGYDTSTRQVNCEAMLAGVQAAQACSTSLAPERITARSFGSYGNMIGEAQTARAESGARSTGMNYDASDGYFPNIVTDVNGKAAVSTFDARFGVPTSVTDANGLTSSTTLDAVGRPVRTLAPSSAGARAAMPSVMAYERCDVSGVTCPFGAGAVTRMVSSQYGSAQSITYQDRFGRTIRTAAKLMDAGYVVNGALLDDNNASVAETRYNARGLVYRQYEPNRGSANANAYTEFGGYDALGRPAWKLQRFNRVDTDDLSGAENYRRTAYLYSGLRTDITVCQVGSASASCNSVAVNADGSPKLVMARVFDSAGKLLFTTDANQKTTRYWFDGAGNPLQITDVLGLNITANYNDFGHRLSVTDPDRGTWNFTYNGFGEVQTQTDARNLVTTLNYDNLGRAFSRTWTEPSRDGSGNLAHSETSIFENSSSTSYGTLKNVVRSAGALNANNYERWERSYSYDALNRAIGSSTKIQVANQPQLTLNQQSYFDKSYGRPKQMLYPQSAIDQQPVSTYLAYNSVGALVKEGFAADYVAINPTSSPAIHQITSTDGRGLVTSESYGVTGSNSADWRASSVFDSSGWLLAQCVNSSGVCSSAVPSTTLNAPLEQRYRFDVYGNLKTQWHSGAWLQNGQLLAGVRGKETYQYDALHRLTAASRTSSNSATETVSYGYDDVGGLLKKSDYSQDFTGAYSYQAGTHKVQSVALKSGNYASYGFDANGNVTQRTESGTLTTLHYDIGNLPMRMQRGFNTSDFYEGPGGRYLQRLVSNGTQRDTYSLDKSYEREIVGGAITLERYYLSSGALMTVAPGSRKLNYLHNDRLGSTVSISEKPMPDGQRLGSSVAVLVEHKGFDAFGKALDGAWGTSNFGMLNLTTGQNFNQGKRTQRGFTGHEHLDEFALIHMNGRVYDYNLGRFYGVDPFIQFPSNSQSLNPYGYLMNNPLSGTDPTGYAGKHICGQEGKPTCDAVITGAKNIAGFLAAVTGAATGNGVVSGLASVLKKHAKAGAADSIEGLTFRALLLPTTDRLGKEGENGSLGDNILGGAQELTNQGLTLVYLHQNIERVKTGVAATNFLANAYVKYKTEGVLTGNSPVLLETPQFEIDKKGLLGASIAEIASILIPVESGIQVLRTATRGSKAIALLTKACCCFAAGTLIHTELGLVPVELIAVGDLVWSRNEATGETALKPVTQLFFTAAKPIYQLTTIAPDGGRETIEVTDNHPYYVIGQGWIDSGKLKPGMRIENFVRGALVVESLVAKNVNEVTYNFTVGDFHTYFVGGQRALVHNCSCFTMALGRSEGLNEFAAVNGAKTFGQLEGTWLPDNLRYALHFHMKRADKIKFNLEGFDFDRYRAFLKKPGKAPSEGNITNWELRKVLNNTELRSKTTFYGQELPSDL